MRIQETIQSSVAHLVHLGIWLFQGIENCFQLIEGDRSKFYFLQEEVREEDPEYKITWCKFAISLLILTEGQTGAGFLNHP